MISHRSLQAKFSAAIQHFAAVLALPAPHQLQKPDAMETDAAYSSDLYQFGKKNDIGSLQSLAEPFRGLLEESVSLQGRRSEVLPLDGAAEETDLSKASKWLAEQIQTLAQKLQDQLADLPLAGGWIKNIDLDGATAQLAKQFEKLSQDLLARAEKLSWVKSLMQNLNLDEGSKWLAGQAAGLGQKLQAQLSKLPLVGSWLKDIDLSKTEDKLAEQIKEQAQKLPDLLEKLPWLGGLVKSLNSNKENEASEEIAEQPAQAESESGLLETVRADLNSFMLSSKSLHDQQQTVVLVLQNALTRLEDLFNQNQKETCFSLPVAELKSY